MSQSADIQIKNVSKIFSTGILKKKVAVEDLTLNIPKGEIVGLLGANGSGKSTTIKMILGFLRPTKGTIEVCGQLAGTRQSRSIIGYLPENPRFQKFLTGHEILTYFGRLYGLKDAELRTRVEEMLQLVGMSHAGQERVGGYSKGMTQRLAIAQALLNRPRLLIFDEPMSGLDPLGRMEIRNLIRRIHQELSQTTIFFSTHILSDIETLCSSVALLKKGKLQTFCAISQLMVAESQNYHVVFANAPSSLQEQYRRDHGATPTNLGMGMELSGTDLLLTRLTELRKAGGKVISINSQRMGLEEALFSDRGTLHLEQEGRQVGGNR